MSVPRGLVHRMSNMYFHSPRITWQWPPVSVPFACSREQHWVPYMAPFPRVISQLSAIGWVYCTASIMEGAAFCSYWQIYSEYGDFPFLPVILLPKLPPWFTDCLTHCHGILHNIASDQGTHFTAIEVRLHAHIHWIHWAYHVPHDPKQLPRLNHVMAFWKLSYSAS